MIKIVETVIAALNEAGIPSEPMYAYGQMPEFTGAHAAVGLEKLDFETRRATVLVKLLSPSALGGSACQAAAVRVGMLLHELGGECTQGSCSFNGYADAFCVEVRAGFFGDAVMEDWAYSSGFTVTLGGTVLTHVSAFLAEQAVDPDTGQLLETGVWNFRLEEEFGLGQAAQPSPAEPFSVMVARSGCTETFRECVWVSVRLETTDTGLRQVRTGIAQSRDYIAVV